MPRHRFFEEVGEYFGLDVGDPGEGTALSDLGFDSLALGELVWLVDGFLETSAVDDGGVTLASTVDEVFDLYLELACRLES